MANFYVDDNSTIHAEQSETGTIAGGSTDEIGLSLADITTSTASTWLINRIKFSLQAYIDPSNVDPGGVLRLLTGVKPRSYTTDINSLDDFQEIKGWPFKDSFYQFQRANSNITGMPSQPAVLYFSKTYVPKEHLALNRFQDVIMSFESKTIGGFTCDWAFTGSIYIQAKRGE